MLSKYGRLMSSDECNLRSKNGPEAGIKQQYGKISFLRGGIGDNAPYPNAVNDDGTMIYCASLLGEADNKALEKSMRLGIEFPVYLFVDKKDNYDWGIAKILSQGPVQVRNGKSYNSFILKQTSPPKTTTQCVPVAETAKRRRTEVKVGTPTCYDGVTYKSILEKNHAHLMKLLGFTFEYEQFTIQESRRVSSYTIDFFVPDLSMFIEIKPFTPAKWN